MRNATEQPAPARGHVQRRPWGGTFKGRRETCCDVWETLQAVLDRATRLRTGAVPSAYKPFCYKELAQSSFSLGFLLALQRQIR